MWALRSVDLANILRIVNVAAVGVACALWVVGAVGFGTVQSVLLVVLTVSLVGVAWTRFNYSPDERNSSD